MLGGTGGSEGGLCGNGGWDGGQWRSSGGVKRWGV